MLLLTYLACASKAVPEGALELQSPATEVVMPFQPVAPPEGWSPPMPQFTGPVPLPPGKGRSESLTQAQREQLDRVEGDLQRLPELIREQNGGLEELIEVLEMLAAQELTATAALVRTGDLWRVIHEELQRLGDEDDEREGLTPLPGSEPGTSPRQLAIQAYEAAVSRTLSSGDPLERAWSRHAEWGLGLLQSPEGAR